MLLGIKFKIFWPYVFNVWIKNKVPIKKRANNFIYVKWWQCKFGRMYKAKGYNSYMRGQIFILKYKA